MSSLRSQAIISNAALLVALATAAAAQSRKRDSVAASSDGDEKLRR